MIQRYRIEQQSSCWAPYLTISFKVQWFLLASAEKLGSKHFRCKRCRQVRDIALALVVLARTAMAVVQIRTLIVDMLQKLMLCFRCFVFTFLQDRLWKVFASMQASKTVGDMVAFNAALSALDRGSKWQEALRNSDPIIYFEIQFWHLMLISIYFMLISVDAIC